jgi:hypothetical protein
VVAVLVTLRLLSLFHMYLHPMLAAVLSQKVHGVKLTTTLVLITEESENIAEEMENFRLAIYTLGWMATGTKPCRRRSFIGRVVMDTSPEITNTPLTTSSVV